VAGSLISPDLFERLADVVEYHGGFLPQHAIREFAEEAGTKPGGLPKAFYRRTAVMESDLEFDLLDPAVESAVRTMATIGFADAADAYSWLRGRGAAPASRRRFNEVLLCNPALPSLRYLREREVITLKLQVVGQGRRPCDDCAADLAARHAS
jgi:hypothetical protein